MKKSIKIVGKIATITIMIVCSYMLGTTQAETVTETIEVIPNNYISLDDCIPLEDIACYFIDGYDYPCFELKDVCNQLNDDNNKSYQEIMKNLTNETEDFKENFVDMRTVINYIFTENGLQLYFEDGSGYYIEGGTKENDSTI